MPRYRATIDIYFELGERWTDPEGALADGISGMMELAQAQTQDAADEFVLVDWSYHPLGGDYSNGYAKPFEGLTPEEELHAHDELAGTPAPDPITEANERGDFRVYDELYGNEAPGLRD